MASKKISAKSASYLSLISLGELRDFAVSESDSRLVQGIHRIRNKILRDFTPSDLRLCIGQAIGLPYLLPKAFDILMKEPWIETDYYPGDLLSSCISVDRSYWKKHDEDQQRMRLVLAGADKAARSGLIQLGRQELQDLRQGLSKFGINTEQGPAIATDSSSRTSG